MDETTGTSLWSYISSWKRDPEILGESGSESNLHVDVPAHREEAKGTLKNPLVPESEDVVKRRRMRAGFKERAKNVGKGIKTANDVAVAATTPTKVGSNLLPQMSNLSTPGGIGLILGAVLFILFAITPAPGHSITRLQLIFKALMGQAQLGDSTSSSGSVNYTSTSPNNPILQALSPTGQYLPGGIYIPGSGVPTT